VHGGRESSDGIEKAFAFDTHFRRQGFNWWSDSAGENESKGKRINGFRVLDDSGVSLTVPLYVRLNLHYFKQMIYVNDDGDFGKKSINFADLRIAIYPTATNPLTTTINYIPWQSQPNLKGEGGCMDLTGGQLATLVCVLIS
jgi:hypothetical protein